MDRGYARFAAHLSLIFLAASHFVCSQAAETMVSDITDAGAKPISWSKPSVLLHDLNEHGISFQGVAVYDWSKTLHGDQDSGSGFGRYSFDLFTSLDGKKAFGLEGSDGLIRLKNHINNFGKIDDGAAQLYSNIDSNSRTTLYELWFEKKLLSNKVRFKGGKIDASTEFAAVQSASDFLNSSMGYSPTIMAFPTYPEPKLGINGFLNLTPKYSLGVGAFETTGMGILTVFEPAYNWTIGQGEHPGRMSFGYWRENGKMAQFDGRLVDGAQGTYAVIEQSGWRHPWMGKDGQRKLGTFLQLGKAQGQLSPVTYHVGGGGVLQSPFRRRMHDSIGVAATWVRFTSDHDAGFQLSSETAFETYYKVALNKHVAMVPDFQLLHHPGGLEANRDCPVITPRVVLSF